jgi:hypothetical protein
MRFRFLPLAAGILVMLPLSLGVNVYPVAAQRVEHWPPQQRIPGYDPEAAPPVMVADQNRTVHAFTSQPVGEEEPQVAVIYNQWTLDQGWTMPIDILLSPRNQARLMDVLLDPSGVMHVIFFGGDETGANIYYSQAPAVVADRAPAWSEPILIGENAISPSTATLGSDNEGNLTVLYSGNLEWNGVYAVYSADRGHSWSKTIPVFLTYSDTLWPFNLQVDVGPSGGLYAVWNVVNEAGHGVDIYYTTLNAGETQWRDPIKLADRGDGEVNATLYPTLMVHDGSIFVVYYQPPEIADTNQIIMRRSEDGGLTWTNSVALFSRHVGVNGEMSMVVDGNDDLHLFFGQRTGGADGDIHGMWHSIWQEGDRWSEPVAVVSGHRVSDYTGNTAFDPNHAEAVVSQGNVLLVAWRSDPGLMGNGVWYSYATVDAPALPVMPLPVLPIASSATVTPTAAPTIPTSTPLVSPSLKTQAANRTAPVSKDMEGELAGPGAFLIFGLLPVVGLIAATMITFTYCRLHRR